MYCPNNSNPFHQCSSFCKSFNKSGESNYEKNPFGLSDQDIDDIAALTVWPTDSENTGTPRYVFY